MAKIDNKLKNLHKMVIALEKSINVLEKNTDPHYTEFFQDSVVARFKILLESTWKNIKLYLEDKGFADVPGSPKDIIHLARDAQLLSTHEHDEFIKYLSLRNLASHLYDQPQYILVVNAAPQALGLFKNIIKRIENKEFNAHL
jgi:nucleotidyltransferase substrate binding protein (TIGR01987 family)